MNDSLTPLTKVEAVSAHPAKKKAPQKDGGLVYRLLLVCIGDFLLLTLGEMSCEPLDIHCHKSNSSLAQMRFTRVAHGSTPPVDLPDRRLHIAPPKSAIKSARFSASL
jgi:hypothetical protein